MKDPARNPALISSFSFTGTIANIRKDGKTMQISINQNVAGRLPSDFRLILPLSAVTTDEFPYVQGDTVLVEDALLYEKEHEFRLRIEDMIQIRGTTADPGDVNTLSFSGTIVDVKEVTGYKLVYMEQSVMDHFRTTLEVMIPGSVGLDTQPKIGDIGFIKSAIFYEKNGTWRAKLVRSTYSILYTPDAVMDLGTIEARERFC